MLRLYAYAANECAPRLLRRSWDIINIEYQSKYTEFTKQGNEEMSCKFYSKCFTSVGKYCHWMH